LASGVRYIETHIRRNWMVVNGTPGEIIELSEPVEVAEVAESAAFVPRIGRSVSLDHAARLLGVSRRTIYNRIRDGRLQTIRTMNGSQRVLIDSMISIVEGRDGLPEI
jgi:excisionase family DNA binding protein